MNMPGKNYSSDTKPDIGIVGAGISGINAAIQLQKQLGIDSYTILEQNEDIGGTWLTNTYPGCACDVPSHLYSYSFEPNPNWSESFSNQQEIWNYLKRLSGKYNIYSHVKFNTFVSKATWDEQLCKWIVVAVDNKDPKAEEKELMFDIVISCAGALRVPNIPKEFLSFEGTLVHTAEWNHDINLENKKVAVIGSGASAIQIIPNIVKTVKELHSYQRKPAYVMPRNQYRYPDFIITLFTYFPILMWLVRCCYFLYRELIMFQAFKPKSLVHKLAIKESRRWRRKQIPDDRKLWNELTPSYTLGCKRIVPSEQYYPAMILPHVKLHTAHIDKVVGKTIYTKDGHSEEIDVLILATGYRVQDYFAPMKVIAKNGEDVLKSWKKYGPKSYYGIVGSISPNSFMILGPNTGLGHNTVIFQIECQTNFIMSVIKEMRQRNARVVTVKESAEEEFMENLKTQMKETIWGTSECGSWYADARGQITTLWPKNCIEYWKQTRKIDFSKFEFQY